MAAEAESGRPFVGRVETVETLRRRFEDARAGIGGVTVLVGETGVGKSVLIDTLVREVRARGVFVLVGRALALDDPPPFSLLRSALESARDDPALRDNDAPFSGGAPVLIGFVPGLGTAAFPSPVGIEGRLLEALSEADVQEERSRDRMFSEMAEQFLELTGRRPAVLVLEDLHRADLPSLEAVEFLAGQLKNRPLWILASSRPYASLSASGRTRLEAFESATRARRVPLRPLNSGEVADYLRTIDPSREFTPEEVARRFSETGGNPLLLQQLDRRIAAGQRAHDPGAAGGSPFGPAEERTLDVASVLGPEFGFDLLHRASGETDEERLAEAVDHLVGQGLLLERPGEVLAFPDDRLREERYDHIPSNERQTLHARVGEVLEARGAAGIAGTYGLARHFYLGRVREKAVRYNRIAAEIAERALAPDVARDHLLRAVESHHDFEPEDLEGESELILDLARITENLGRLPEAEAVLRDFLIETADNSRLTPRRRATLEVFLSLVLAGRGEMAASAEVAKKVLETPGVEEQPLLGVGCHHQMGMALYYEGRYAEALDHHTEEVRLARLVGNERVVLRAQVWRLANLAMIGRIQEAIAEAREVTAARDRLGSPRESAMAHLVMGDFLADSRCTPAQRQEAVEQYAQAIRFAEEAQDPRRVGWANYKTAELLLEAGRLEGAAEKVATACDTLRAVGDQAGLSLAIKVRGQIAMREGAYDRAAADLDEAYRLIRDLDRALEEIDIVLRLAELSLARGDRESARRRVTELERLKLLTARPDLAEEYEKLRQGLDRMENQDAPR